MDIQQQIDKSIKDYSNSSQFGVYPVPAHTHNGTDSLHVSFLNLDNRTRYIIYRIVGNVTNTSIANVVGGDFVMPFNGIVMSVGATVDTAGTTNTTTIDVNKNGSSIMNTKITIDSGEKTSRTAATPPVVNSTTTVNNFFTGDIFTFDVDAVSSTPAKGLTIFMNVVEN